MAECVSGKTATARQRPRLPAPEAGILSQMPGDIRFRAETDAKIRELPEIREQPLPISGKAPRNPPIEWISPAGGVALFLVSASVHEHDEHDIVKKFDKISWLAGEV
jgi:hypothetical protein